MFAYYLKMLSSRYHYTYRFVIMTSDNRKYRIFSTDHGIYEIPNHTLALNSFPVAAKMDISS